MTKLIFPFIWLLACHFNHAQFLSQKNDLEKFEGFFNYYYDKNEDKIYLEVEQTEQEFLYVHYLAQGIGSNDIGLDRGQLGGGVIVKFIKSGNKLLLIQPNLRFRASTDNEAEKRSVEEAFAKSVLYGFEILEEKEGVYVIDITDFFIRDAHGVAIQLKNKQQGTYSLDKTRSSFNMKRTKAFPKNIEIDVLLTYGGNASGREIWSVSPDASSVTVYQHHAFVELPDDGYKPRTFDPRSGAYPLSYMDYATPVDQSIVKKLIYRHRLRKKNPGAKRSEAVRPIIYYLDPGTPEPVRTALMQGANWWNEAFEAAGYINAFQVKLLPAEADPLDIRYNVIQWVHRSTRGWSYGNTITDPRTGEIIKGHVNLGSLRIRQDFMIAQSLKAPYATDENQDIFALEMSLARIRQLSAHEVGHTLGFAHNFAASTNSRASVMDYPHPYIKVKNGRLDFTEAYAEGIGSWDKVVVAYAYKEFPDHEGDSLRSVLDRAFERGHRFISDADARPLGSAHAYAHLWDNGNDIVEELYNVLEVRKLAISEFSADNIKKYQTYSELEDVFVPLYFYHRYQTEAVAKMIGGLDYSYAIKGVNSLIVKKLDPKKQREALTALMESVSVETLMIDESKLLLFPPRAMGFERTRESFESDMGVAFDPYAAVASASNLTFSVLLHPERISRLILQKSLDKKQLGYEELLDTLIANTFKIGHKDNYKRELQNIINETLLHQIFKLTGAKDHYLQVRAVGMKKISEIMVYLKERDSKGYQRMADDLMIRDITEFLKDPEWKKMRQAPKLPDGSPIGMP
jgi:hypothetical protein